jgi:Ni,Fe-hydrogenase III large subunit/Ni,Fe-hydrogenase III component G
MHIEDFDLVLSPLAGAAPVWHGDVDAAVWRQVCQQAHDKGGRLVALWGGDRRESGCGFVVHAALVIRSGLVWLTLAAEHEAYPGIDDIFPAASRMQRALGDLLGIHPNVSQDARPWLRHSAWPADQYPLRKDFDGSVAHPAAVQVYPFVTVEGDGVHEIAVGPVHAGTIEPGHFRFSVIGEKILRLEPRLGYTHKGVEKLFETLTLEHGARLAGRISGDSTVAYAWAYAMAAESVSSVTPPERALWLRALLLERERLANHLGDLGALGNDAGLAFGLAQFSCLKEDLLRTNATLFGHRYLMDSIVPGGVANDLDEVGAARLLAELDVLDQTVRRLHHIYDDHAGLQDRFIGTGRVPPELAVHLGLCGLAGRASAQAWDLRAQFPTAPYDHLEVQMATHRNGDVAARVTVRFDEVSESIRLCRLMLKALPGGAILTPLPTAPDNAMGVGWVEGWRGEVFVALETGPDNRIRRLHPHDPSWQNWPLIEHAVMDNIVPDFPLINKSFNLSYSGHDL